MHVPNDPEDFRCPAKCRNCLADDRSDFDAAEAPYHGAALAAIAAAIFLAPVAMAILGALLLPMLWPHRFSQAVGAVGGLGLGVLDSMVIAAIFRRWRKKKA